MPAPIKSGRLSAAAVVIALLAVLIHVVINYLTPYGFHRDEFLYLAMGERLRLWQMDFPPFIAVVAEYSRAWFGDSLRAIRLFPAIAGGLLILLSVDITRRLGGGMGAQVLAAVLMLVPALFLRTASLFQPVVFDQLWWTLGMWCLLRWRQSSDNRWWIGLGVVLGIGLFTKFSILIFGAGVLAGLLATKERRLLATRWPWIALLLTLAIGSPSIVGQIRLGFPVLGQINDLRSSQLLRIAYADFLFGQVFMLGISIIPAVIGAGALLVSKRFASYRILGWAFVGTFLILLLAHGKAYYLGPMYPAMIGAGAVVLERGGTGRSVVFVRRFALAVILVLGIAAAPLGLPILPPPQMEQYSKAIGLTVATQTNTGEVIRLPQDYADMLGWEERVAEIAKIYKRLSPVQRSHATIIAGNYGEAGAVDFFGPRYGLPRAVCVSGSYWYFGPGDKPGRVAITIGCDEKSLRDNWRTVTRVAELSNEWTVPEEQHLSLYLCEYEKETLQALWPKFEGIN